jgi:hypothetical protein
MWGMGLSNKFNFNINKGLIIAPPWSTLITEGHGYVDGDLIRGKQKTLEMRHQNTFERGWFALIEKGSGHITGIFKISSSTGPYSKDELLDMENDHYIPSYYIRDTDFNRPFAWHIKHAFALDNPVPFKHKAGQSTWVHLSEHASQELANETRKTLNRIKREAGQKNYHRKVKRVENIKKDLGLTQ